MRSDIPPGYGYLEYLEERSNQLVLAGWLTLLDGAFDSYEGLECATGRRGPVDTIERDELGEAHPHIPNARCSATTW